MRTILSARLAHLRVIGSLWAAGGAERALTKVRHSTPRAPLPSLLQARSAAALPPRRAPPSHAQALDLDELPVLVDVLNASQLALQRGGGLELLQARLAYVSLSRLRSARRARRLRDVLMHASATVPTSTPSSDPPHRTACPRSAGSSTRAMKTTSSAASPPQPRCSSRSRPCCEKRSRLRAPTVLTAAALGSSAEALESISRRRSGEIAASRSATACASCSRGWWRWRREEGGRRSWRRGW